MNPIFFVPLTTPEGQRSAAVAASAAASSRGGSPFRSASHYSPSALSNANGSDVKIDSFSEARDVIVSLRQENEKLKRSNEGLQTLVARGPGLMGERIKVAEARSDWAVDIALARAGSADSLAHALLAELDVSCKVKDEVDAVVAQTSSQLDETRRGAAHGALAADVEMQALLATVQRYIGTGIEMGALIGQQAARIHELDEELDRLGRKLYLSATDSAQRESQHQANMAFANEQIAVLRRDLAQALDKSQIERQLQEARDNSAHWEDAAKRASMRVAALDQTLAAEQAAHARVRKDAAEMAERNDKAALAQESRLRAQGEQLAQLQSSLAALQKREAQVAFDLEETQQLLDDARRDHAAEAERATSARSELAKRDRQLKVARRVLIGGGGNSGPHVLTGAESEAVEADLRADIEETAEAKARLEEKLAAEAQRIVALQAELDAASRSPGSNSGVASVASAAQTKLPRLQRAIEEHERTRRRLQQEVQRLDALMEELRRELDQLRRSREEQMAAIQRVERERAALLAATSEKSTRLAQLEEERAAAEAQRLAVEQRLSDAQRRADETGAELQSAKQSLLRSQDDVAAAVDQVRRALSDEIARAQHEAARLQADLDAKTAELSELQRERDEAREARAAHAAKLEEARQEEQERQREVAERIRTLEASSEQQLGDVVTRLLEQQKQRWTAILHDVAVVMDDADRDDEDNEASGHDGAPRATAAAAATAAASSPPAMRHKPEPFQSEKNDAPGVREIDRRLQAFREMLLDEVHEKIHASKIRNRAAGQRAQSKSSGSALVAALQDVLVDVEKKGFAGVALPAARASSSRNLLSRQQEAALLDVSATVAAFKSDLLKRIEQLRREEDEVRARDERKRIAAQLLQHRRVLDSEIAKVESSLGLASAGGGGGAGDSGKPPAAPASASAALLEDTASLDRFEKQVAAAFKSVAARMSAEVAETLQAQTTACDAALLELDEIASSSPPTAAAAARDRVQFANLGDVQREMRFFATAHAARVQELRSARSAAAEERTALQQRLDAANVEAASAKEEFRSFQQQLASSKEFQDAANVSELRRQLAASNSALKHILAEQMRTREIESRASKSQSPGGAAAGARPSPQQGDGGDVNADTAPGGETMPEMPTPLQRGGMPNADSWELTQESIQKRLVSQSATPPQHRNPLTHM